MKPNLYIRLPIDGAPVAWLRVDDSGTQAGHSPLADLAVPARQCQVTIFVPGTDVFIAEAHLPTRRHARILQALPYALEDQLADDIERLHFAVGPRQGDGVLAGVVDRERLRAWLAQLEDAGVVPDRLVPEGSALPLADSWSLLLEPHQALLRTGPGQVLAFDGEQIAELVGMAVAASESPPKELRLFDCRESSDGGFVAAGLTVAASPCPWGALGALAEGMRDGNFIDLLQGEFSRHEAASRQWRRWRVAAALTGALLLLQAGLGIEHRWRLQQEDAQLAASIDSLYRETFPDATRVVNARVQMEQQLERLRSGAGGDAFAALLTDSGPLLKQTPALQIKGLRYRDGQLELDLTLANLQGLDRLKQQLSDSGLRVEIVSASARDNRVESRITLQGGRA